jgi:hypothetical protein
MTSMTNRVRRWAIAAALCSVVTIVSGCGGNPAPDTTPALPAALSAAGPLLGSLSKAIPGLSQAHAILGAGSLLGLAKAKMPTDQFSQIAAAIPGAEALVGEAVKLGLPSGLTGLSGLTGFLGKGGVSASQVSQMVPVLTGAVTGKVSPELAAGFLSALQ